MRVCRQQGRSWRPVRATAGLAAAVFLAFGGAKGVAAADTTPIPLPPASVLTFMLGGGGGSSSDAPPAPAQSTDLSPAAAPRAEQPVINPLEALTPFLPGPGEWRQVPGLQFERFGLSDQEANALNLRGTDGSAAVLSQQTGSAYDPEGFLWYFWGGGANAYGGNEVYRLDLTLPLMSQITQPSVLDSTVQVPNAANCFAPSDGPAAGSTFDGFVWSPATQSFFVFPSASFCPSGVFNPETVWEFDPLMGTWDAVASMTGLNGPAFAEYDPVTGLIFVVETGSGATLRDFDPVTGQLGARVPLGQALSVGNAVLDSQTDEMIVFAQEGVFAISLTNPGTIRRLADAPSGFDPTSGAALDAQSGVVALWDGGKNVRSFDLGTAEWTEETAASGPTSGAGGVFSKWIAIREFGIFAGYHNPAEGLWLYRLPTTLNVPAPANRAPVAFAGNSQIGAHTGSVVNLDGSGSFDPDGDTLTYAWSAVSSPAGNSPTLTTPNQATTSFTPAVNGGYVIRLTVSDGALSDTVTVTVTAGNAVPVADAGSDQAVQVGQTVALSASGSSDADGDTLGYSWSLTTAPSGSNAALSGAQSVSLSFVPDAEGTYILSLTVSDGIASALDTVNVAATAAPPVNSAPVANAGPDQTLTEGQTATLNGLQSSDPEGDSLSYSWSLTTQPAGSSASLSSTAAAQPTLTLDVAGDYVVGLTVSDGQLTSTADQVKITAEIDLGTAGGGSGNIVHLHPGGSFEAAVEALLPGDTLIVHEGTYSETGRVSIQVKGTAQAPVVIETAQGEARPLITRPSSASLENTINIEGAAFLTVKGLEIAGNGGDGINMSGGPSNITLEDLEIHDIDVGINFRSSMSGIVARGNHIYNTGIGGGTGEGMYVGCNNNACAVSDTIIENNLIHDNLPGTTQGDGIEVKPGSYNVAVRDNVIHDMNYPCIFVYGNGPERNIVERNVLWNCNEAIQAVSDAVIRNNIVLNSGTGITAAPHVQVGQMDNMTIVNNTFYGHSNECLFIRWSGATGMVLANNAAYCAGSQAVNAGGLSGADITLSSNYVEGGMSGASIDNAGFIFGGDAGSEFGDPAGFDFWPTEASVLRDTADTAHAPTDDFNGMSRSDPQDVGAYETNGLASNPGESILALAGTPGNTGPVANAGADQSATVGDIVSLSGSGSDTDGDSLTFDWSFVTRPSGSNAVLSGAQSATPTFPADAAGTYTLRLSVSDGTLSGSDEVSVSVAAAAPTNRAPVASAGPDQTLIEGQTATLNGLQSSDPDGDSLSYSWSLTTRPAGSSASLSSTTAAQPTLTLDVAGDYLVGLTVSDGQLTSTPDQVKITANIDSGTSGGGSTGGSADLVAYWALDDGSGTTVTDASGGGSTGAVAGGPTWITGALGSALNFNGANQYVEFSSANLSSGLPAAGTNPSDDFTLAAWVRLDQTNDRRPIVAKQGTGEAGNQRGFVFGVASSGLVEFEFFKSDVAGSSLNSSHSLTAGQWYHVAVTYDFIADGTSQARIFVNGVESRSITNAVGPVQGNNQPLNIGRYFWSSSYSRYFDGTIDDVRVYGRALATSEVRGLYDQAAGSLPPPAPTVAFSASPTSVNPGQSSTLSWSSAGATACSASGGWSGAKTTGGSQPVTPSAATTYTLTCTGPGGSATTSASVSVFTAPPPGGGGTVTGSSLAEVAANLAPGQWGELQTNNIDAVLHANGASGQIMGYSDDMNWNPVTRQLQFVGGDHQDVARFVTYEESTNTWTDRGVPSWIFRGTSHGYDHMAVDPATGDFFSRKLLGPEVYRWNGQQWDVLPPSNISYPGNIAMAIEYFPEMGGLVWVSSENGEANRGGVVLWERATNGWRRLAQNLPMGDYHTMAEYNPVHKVVVFGGGDVGVQAFYSLDAQGNVKTLAKPPSHLGIQRAVLTVDPVTGDYLVIFSNGQFWIYDVIANRWTQQNTTVPVYSNYTGDRLMGVTATPVADYGVVLFATCNRTKCRVTLYKHAESTGGSGTGGTGGSGTGGGTPPPTPTVTLAANPGSITTGQSATLSWSSTNADSCSASGGWTGNKTPANGSESVSPVQTATYTLSCTGAGGSASNSATVAVTGSTQPPLVIGSGIGGFEMPSVQDEKDTYTSWGWSWTSGQEPRFSGDPSYAVSPDIHDVSEGDDLWTYLMMYLRSGEQGYLDRATYWADYFKNRYRTSASFAYDRDNFSMDHMYGWGLVAWYEYTGDLAALDEAENLAALLETLYANRVPGSYPMSFWGKRGPARHLHLVTRVAEATGKQRWINLRDKLIDLWVQSTDWDPRGMYFLGSVMTDQARGANAHASGSRLVLSFHVGLLTEAFAQAYRVTGREDIKNRMIAMAYFINQHGLDPTYQYTGSTFGIVNGQTWHNYSGTSGTATFWDPVYTSSMVNTLVWGYKLTGDQTLLDRARHTLNRGTKGVYGSVTQRSAADNQVDHFVDTQFDKSLSDLYFANNKGELRYTYMLFENGGFPTVAGGSP